MKNLKPSKLLIFSLSVATLIVAFTTPNVNAQSQVQYNRSVRDMMARRHNASVKPSKSGIFSSTPKQEEMHISSKNVVGVRPAYTPPKTSRIMTRAEYDASVAPKYVPEETILSAQGYSATNAQSYSAPKKSSSWFSSSSDEAPWYPPADKDGSLFPGGPCRNCHKSGPLIDTGPCERCYDTGGLIDTGPCERCYDTGGLIDTGPCEKCKEEVREVVAEPECTVCAEPELEPACTVCAEPEPKPACTVCVEPEPKPVCSVCHVPQLVNYPISYNDFVVQAMARNCCDMAPIYLDYVDFNLAEKENTVKNKMGNYRFRIFGCRRYDKEAVLNHGRVMEKNMRFADIFKEVTGDCYNIIEMPKDICLEKTPSPLPEYILTAEITDFFMNVCDKYDWEQAKASDARTGSSEITVRWKLTNPSKTKIVWEGETTGYADLRMGLEDGEVALVEAAFADAVSNLQAARGFENQLMIRLTPEELTAERNALIDEEHAIDPVKCKFAEPFYAAKQCEITRPEANIEECPAYQQQILPPPPPCAMAEPCPIAEPVVEENGGVSSENLFLEGCIDENGGVKSDGSCHIVDDTWVDTELKAFDSLCITTRAPYDVLTPENLYKVRASVVEISNVAGKKGAGLIVSDSFVITSANLVDNQYNTYKIRTINGKNLSGRAVRVNPSKNTALIMLDTKTEYTPLSLNTDLPKTGQSGFMTLGLLDVEAFDNGSENYIDNSGKILGYRYSDDKGSEIIVDTNVQDITIGSVLIDSHGTVNGFAHTGQKTDSGKDLFLPTETTLRSLGLTICDCVWETPSQFQQTVYKPVTELVHTIQKAPEELKKKDRK